MPIHFNIPQVQVLADLIEKATAESAKVIFLEHELKIANARLSCRWFRLGKFLGFAKVVVFCLLASRAFAGDPLPATPPAAPALTLAEKEQIYKLQIAAHRALERVQMAQVQQRQGRIDELTSQKELDRLNADLERMNLDLSKKYDADGKFNLTPDLAFEPKEPKK